MNARFREVNRSASASDVEQTEDSGSGAPHDRSIGAIISDLRDLSGEQVEQILAYQHKHQVRFGEAAIALGFANSDDVLRALSQQFHYPYAPTRDGSPELITLMQPFSPQAESFRAIRSQIMMRLYHQGGPRKALAVISPDTGDGKSYFAANMAVALAQLDARTLIVDADLRGPRLHEIFGVENKVGLSSVLSGRPESKVIKAVRGVPSLFVLPVGATPPNPAELLERPAFGLLMRELLGKFDHVIVDTPAAVYGPDASVIAARCGSALVLARKGQSRVADLLEMVGSFQDCPVQIAGVVLNEF